MVRFSRTRAALIAAFLSAVAILAAAVFFVTFRQALDQVAARGQADLTLAADRLVTQLHRYRESAVLLSDHPTLEALHAGGDRAEADALLLSASDKTAALTAFYADPEGRVLASAHGLVPEGLRDSGYFQRAMDGALGAALGSSTGIGARAFSYAAPSFGPDGRVQGALIVVVDIDNLEQDWRGSRPVVYFTDEGGRVLVTNRSELLFWTRRPGGMRDSAGALRDVAETQLGGHEIWRQALSPYVPDRALHLVQPLPVIGMTGEALVDIAPALRLGLLQAAAVAALCLSFGALLFLATERRRALALANTALETRVAERTRELSQSNAALRREVAEREEAEAALKRAQADLVQAGKLSALGQMSAGISHELNQPLMAIRSFAENGAAFLDRGKPKRTHENLVRISEMAHRMGRIIKNLRAFARQEHEPVRRVDLVAVVQGAVELAEPRLRDADVALDWVPPAEPIWVRGGEVRLGQVFLNLIGNAADAMAGSPRRELSIRIDAGSPLLVVVRDSGPGIEEPEKIFDPFYTTKAVGSGDGMGLGLSISYGLVQSFGGTIRGANAEEGGSVFTVELERWDDAAPERAA